MDHQKLVRKISDFWALFVHWASGTVCNQTNKIHIRDRNKHNIITFFLLYFERPIVPF